MAAFLKIFLILGFLAGLPLCGIVLAGLPLSQYLEFPPLTRYVEHAPFSWPVFLTAASGLGAGLGYCVWRVVTGANPPRVYCSYARAVPWWGWVGFVSTGIMWLFAWTRFPWFADFQIYTFTPLWVGYIFVVNAVTFQRTGHCLVIDRPGYFLALFPLSAVAWWFFEYFNRFVQNWYYVGGEGIGPWEYVLHGTHSFSTVLPAVLSTAQCLGSFSFLDRAFRDLWAVDLDLHPMWGWVSLGLGGAGLFGIGVWPNYLFPLLWVSPLLVIVGVQWVVSEDTVFSRLADGDWRPVCIPALAGLVCGFFWEMWNSRSLAHWEYAIPYVHGFQLFEMPILGYGGYVPFGLECAVVAGLIAKKNGTD